MTGPLPVQMVVGMNQFANLSDNVPVETYADKNASLSHHHDQGIILVLRVLVQQVALFLQNKKLKKDSRIAEKSSEGTKVEHYANTMDGVTISSFVSGKNLHISR
jgi:hypothetical protein